MSIVTLLFKKDDQTVHETRQAIGIAPASGDTAEYIAISMGLDDWAEQVGKPLAELKWDRVDVENGKSFSRDACRFLEEGAPKAEAQRRDFLKPDIFNP